MDKGELLKRIAEKEYAFFSRLRIENRECERERTFKFMRIARFYPYSTETLLSYLRDLENAERENHNPLLEKYACIEGKRDIPKENMELLQKIVDIEAAWIRELHLSYPHAIQDVSAEFQRYLLCELATFSQDTLRSYMEDLERALKRGKNLAYESYLYTFTQLGYSSLEEVEERMKKRQEKKDK